KVAAMSEASSLKLGSWFGRPEGEESSLAGTLELGRFCGLASLFRGWRQLSNQRHPVVPMSSTHNPLAWIEESLGELERAGLRRRLTVRSGTQTARVVLDGRELVNFGSNDYLGLAADERLAEAARIAGEREGWGGGASPLVSGRSETHAALERKLAEF